MDTMKAIILGSGSALPDPSRGNPSQAVRVGADVLLFDCGERATVNLVRSGVNPLKVDHVFFTHLHWDHIADFNYFLMTTWNCGRAAPLHVYGPSGTRHMVQSMLEAHSLDVAFIKRFLEVLPEHVTERPVAELPIEVREIEEGTVLATDRYRVTAREVAHLNLIGFERSSYGYRVESDQGAVALTGDTEPCESMIELARGVDVLIHECTFLEETIEKREMRGHSGPRGAGRVARLSGAKKLVLTHLGPYDSPPAAVEMASMYYGPRRGPEVWSRILREAASEFDGPILLGEDAMEIEIPARS